MEKTYIMNEPRGKSLVEKFIEQHGDKIMKDTLKSLEKEIQRLKNDKEELRIKDNDNFWEIRKLKKENKELKEKLAECDDLMEELDFWKREAKRLGWRPNLS